MLNNSVSEEYLRECKKSEDKFRLSLKQRQEIFRAVVATEERARLKAEVIEGYGINEDIEMDIAVEGITYNWAY